MKKGCTCAVMAQEKYREALEISDIIFEERINEKR